MTTQITPTTLDALAWRIADHGVDAVIDDVRSVGQTAAAHGVSPVLVAVLLDPAQPEVARQRAFGAIAAALTGRLDAAAVFGWPPDALPSLGPHAWRLPAHDAHGPPPRPHRALPVSSLTVSSH